MPVPPDHGWRSANVIECLDRWIECEQPNDDLRILVTVWLLTRLKSPYEGVRRAGGFANLWYGAVPDSLHGDRVVVCSYWVEETERSLRCDSIATLTWPV